MVWPGWEAQLLQALGMDVHPTSLALLRAWAACEGGHARFNPLNTTYELHGSTRYNSAGVRNYLDRTQGLAGTMLTIRLPYYDDLRVALASAGLPALERLRRGADGISTWGTDVSCIRSRLAA